jgi:hypothetical protein
MTANPGPPARFRNRRPSKRDGGFFNHQTGFVRLLLAQQLGREFVCVVDVPQGFNDRTGID